MFVDHSKEDLKCYKREMTAYLKNHPKRPAGPESPFVLVTVKAKEHFNLVVSGGNVALL